MLAGWSPQLGLVTTRALTPQWGPPSGGSEPHPWLSPVAAMALPLPGEPMSPHPNSAW